MPEDYEHDKDLDNVIRDGITTQVMATLTGGIFLVAFALQLGASNKVIGLLAAIPPLTQLIQIPAIYLVERFRKRKRIVVWAVGVGRVFFLLIAAIPFLFSVELGIASLLFAIFMQSSFGAVAGCSWNSWMRDLVPDKTRARFFSHRMAVALAVGIPLSLGAGMFIDQWKVWFPGAGIYAYSILFAIGFMAGMLGVYFISRIPEPELEEVNYASIRTSLSLPFKDANFRKVLIFSGWWNFAVNLAAPFFTVYMLKTLGVGMSVVVSMLVVSQTSNLLFLRLWGRFADRFSNKSVLGVSGMIFIFSILGWTFLTLPDIHFLTMHLLTVLHVFMGMSTAGVSVSLGSMSAKLAPRGRSTPYLASDSIVNSLAAGAAPLLGGFLADYFAEKRLDLVLNWVSPESSLSIPTLSISGWDFFFALAFLVGLYAMHRLSHVHEEGAAGRKAVMGELVSEVSRSVRDYSPVAGLNFPSLFPFGKLLNQKKKKSN